MPWTPPLVRAEEITRLLGAMRTVPHDALICGAAAGYGSDRHRKCDDLKKAIDALAEELTGDPEFY
jgi:hypothetical protein